VPSLAHQPFRYNGRQHDHISKVKTLLSKLSAAHISPKQVVVVHAIPHSVTHEDWPTDWVRWEDFQREAASEPKIPFVRLPFDYPLWILFSSGTTGKPKAIVHRAGGMLLQSNKELAVCAGVTADDVFFYYTTT
jgi:acetoacetyl-CoA synthetase